MMKRIVRQSAGPAVLALVALVACAPATPPPSVPASAAPAAATAATGPVSTLGGVYTMDQAVRGRRVYLGLCRSCHNPSTGQAFATLWVGKTVGDLFMYIWESMPPNEPRTLISTDNADIIGFLLQSAGMPPGGRELPPDRDSLARIRIEMKK
jgi:hypothetical protein